MSIQVKVKWGKELFEGVEVNMDEEPMVFKAQLFALTGVEPHRQKVLCKGASLKDDSWDSVKPKVKPGTTFLLMGSKEEDIPTQAVEKTQFIEDMDESELHSALKLPAGLTNLGNTCYMNATIQCLKTVPEFCQSLLEFKGSIGVMGGPDHDALSITAAMRDLYRSMDRGASVPPLVMLQVLHNAFPRFAERGEGGGYQQQDANECWIELMGMLKRKLKDGETSVVDKYFGLEFESETKCVECDDEPPTVSTERFLQYNCYIDKDVKYLATGLSNRLQESMNKHSETLGRDAVYMKKMRVSRLPGYMTIQMVRFQFKQRDAVNAKILKDIKFPLILDVFDLCSSELQQKLIPIRSKFKDYEDMVVEEASKAKGMSKEKALKKDREEMEAKEIEPYSFEDDPGSNNSGYYELQAILTHKGRSSNSGHYVAWIRHKGDTWFECNDDLIQPIHVDDILKLSGGGDWHTAYLLLYGPRKLPKFEKKPEAAAKAAEATATEEKMET